MINLGCGTRLHRDWVNIDFSPLARRMRYPLMMHLLGKLQIISKTAYDEFLEFQGAITLCDIGRFPLPFPTGCAKVVYHSNVLEHFPKAAGFELLRECHRLLKPGGWLRIVVPNLEVPMREYLASIEPIFDVARYDRAMYLLFDQMVRTESASGVSKKLSPAARIKKLLGLAPTPERLGELHKWMYDRHSLPKLLSDLGFSEIAVLDYKTSRIDSFAAYYLDNEPDSSEYKQDMLYVEARR